MPRPPITHRLVFLALIVFLGFPTAAIAQQGSPPVAPQAGEGGGGSSSTVVPDGETIYALPGSTGNQAVFTVTNTGASGGSFALSCSAAGTVTCGSYPASVTLDPQESAPVVVAFGYGAGGGTGQLTLATPHDQGAFTVRAWPLPSVSLVLPAQTTTARAVVRNRQPLIRALLKPGNTAAQAALDTTTIRLTWRDTVVTALARVSRGLLEWEVDSARGLAPGDSAKVAVRACAINTTCTEVTRWVVLPADSAPVIGFTGMPLEALGAGFSAPFGPGLTVHQAEVETGVATVPYSSMGVPRSTGLAYSTRQSYPRALVLVDLELPWPTGNPDQVKLVLRDGVVALDSLVLAGPSCLTGSARRCRASLQADFSAASHPVPSRKWLSVEARVTSGSTIRMSTDSVEVVVVDRRSTRYGSGWWPTAGIQLVPAGHDRLLVSASGAATIFRGHGDSVFLAPPGDDRTLRRVGSTLELTARGSLARTMFEVGGSGRLVASIDAYGNRDSVVYDGATDRILSVLDPLGKAIAFGYAGNGKLTHFTILAGTSHARESRVTIDPATNRLLRDSASSPAARPYNTTYTYQGYPGTQTVLLTQRIGVILDSTRVVYDSTFRRRPIESRLPLVTNESGLAVKPVLGYTPYERQGFGSLRSLDSVYVETRDPRGAWARTLLNRWGQGRRSWDALGVLARSSYSPDGLPLWTEGPVADSSRVFSGYDVQRRLVRTFVVRGVGDTLRTDSVAYDSQHRVTHRVDSRGRVTRYVYNAQGSATHVISPGSESATAADTTRYWYRPDGLVDSARGPLDTAATRWSYDPSWLQVAEAFDQSGESLGQVLYDGFGLDTARQGRVRVSVTTGVGEWSWRKSRPYRNAANQVDSVLTMRTAKCADPCTTPVWPLPNHPFLVERTTVFRDRAGRDSVQSHGSANGAVTYRYDRLGRLLSRRPTTGGADSTIYDAAGNAVRRVTRRGHVIAAAFDSRGRDTMLVIPGVGTVRRAYGGPAGQLSRIWATGIVDSIGGVNGELRWGYDLRGRLRSDSAWTGSLVRARSYQYDAHDRPIGVTDPLGSWATRYETHRGLADTLLTPFGDSLLAQFDDLGRPVQLVVRNGGPVQSVAWGWLPAGQLSMMEHVVVGSYSGGRFERVDAFEGPGSPLVPQWSAQDGPGAPIRAYRDTVDYDGLGRVVGVSQTLDVGGSASPDSTWSYGFDDSGNLFTPAGAESYGARLLGRQEGATALSYSYDVAGNLTGYQAQAGGSGHAWELGYDALDRLRSVRRDGVLVARYGYDLVGRRIAKRVYSGATGGVPGYTRFGYSGEHVAFETDSAGAMGRAYVWGAGTDQLVGFRDPDGTRYYAVKDLLGSVRAVVRRDGAWMARLRHDPYGRLVDSAGTPFGLRYRWTGREYDAETGFYFHRARYYDPGAKRFIQEDPIGYAGGRNLYAYVEGRVLEATDPGGMRPDYLKWMECSDAACMPDPGWDGWIGAMGSLLPTLVTHVMLNGRVILTIPIRYEDYVRAIGRVRSLAAGNNNAAAASITWHELLDGASALTQGDFAATFLVAEMVNVDGLMGDLVKAFNAGFIFHNESAVALLNRRLSMEAGAFTNARLGWHVLGNWALADVGWATVHEVLHSTCMCSDEGWINLAIGAGTQRPPGFGYPLVLIPDAMRSPHFPR
ncbi:MAG TPA: RHS repeat-associated core domain-containing protein [Gemmatimonadales bacterium]|nr:RHS repeat-associated core domain-containing protein [Gemmatimonadales bacterium]